MQLTIIDIPIETKWKISDKLIIIINPTQQEKLNQKPFEAAFYYRQSYTIEVEYIRFSLIL